MALPSSARLPPFLSTLIRPAVTYNAPDTPHTHTRVKLGAAKKKKKEIRQNEKTKQKQTDGAVSGQGTIFANLRFCLILQFAWRLQQSLLPPADSYSQPHLEERVLLPSAEAHSLTHPADPDIRVPILLKYCGAGIIKAPSSSRNP